jgi:thiol-disulfide isomerase/thioredoxin
LRIVGLDTLEPAQRQTELNFLIQYFDDQPVLTGWELSAMELVGARLMDAGAPDLARSAFANFRRIAQKKGQEQAAAQLLATARRVTLPGSAMTLRGTRVDQKADGSHFDLSDLANRDTRRVVLIDFFSTSCGPCAAEVPGLKERYAQHHDRQFEIVSVSLYDDVRVLREYLTRLQLPWIVLVGATAVDNVDADEYYDIRLIPTAILIGRDGKVISTTARVPELDRLLIAALATP